MNVAQLKLKLGSIITTLVLVTGVFGQTATQQHNAHAPALQSATTALGNLPEADTFVYLSPRRILNEAAPKVLPAAEVEKMRAAFVDIKRAVGLDPSTVEHFALALRFNKPAADLSFVPPELLAVISGDFSSDSMITLVNLYVQESARTEAYRSKTLTIVKVDPIAQAAAENPILKSFTELGVVALNSNTLAIGNVSYLKSAIDASEGTGRISTASLSSLLRDPNALISASGSPLTAFVKSFGMLGTQSAPREASCTTRFGDFYGAMTLEGINFKIRGAMNTDNPETARIIHGLLSSVLEPAIKSIGDPQLQELSKKVKMSAADNEIVWEGEISEETVANFVREQTQSKPAEAKKTSTTPTKKPASRTKRRVRRK